ncbi:hypothetical protein HPP92_013998 [Vanilla planifolia]|uniref:Uncharacterized protein n=1 Tax=Vanilla planifolia TaxID=51239 RepID=A0A835UX08_VANPL|nr:hypothetical protein HPP92_013998 [Vanilla planifolia]
MELPLKLSISRLVNSARQSGSSPVMSLSLALGIYIGIEEKWLSEKERINGAALKAGRMSPEKKLFDKSSIRSDERLETDSGNEPWNLLLHMMSALKKDALPMFFGSSPSSAFLERSIKNRVLANKDGGRTPVSLFPAKNKNEMLRSASQEGILPESLLCVKSRIFSFFSSNRSKGTKRVSELSESASVRRLESFPISKGINPLRLL